MDVLKKKKLINEYNRPLSGYIAEKNSNIPTDFLTNNSIDGIVTDPENRTIWINGMPFGNSYATYVENDNSTGSFHTEIFNDFGNMDSSASILNIKDTDVEKIGSETGTTSRQNTFNSKEFEQLLKASNSNISIDNFINVGESVGLTSGHIVTDSDYSHLEGFSNEILNSKVTHIEGSKNYVRNANFSHIEGLFNRASAEGSHIEGFHNTTQEKALFSHAEGLYTDATAVGSHVEGIGTITANSGEHAEGHYNYSVKYTDENNNDVLNTNNMIVHTVGIGDSSKRKNAIRIDKDGSIYLAAVNKVQDSSVTTYDPCNYKGQSIYSDAISNNEERTLESKSLQELLVNINHSESYTYWMLKEMSKNKLLAPGKTYRITDYKIGVNNTFKDKFDSANNIYDILVTASSNNEFNTTAKAVKHNFYGGEGEDVIKYFENSDLDSWKLDYIFDNSKASKKVNWIDTSEIPPRIHVVFPKKDSSVFDFYDDDELNARLQGKVKDAIQNPSDFNNWINNAGKYEYIKQRTTEGETDKYYNNFANHTVWSYADMYFYTCDEEENKEGNAYPIESQHPYRYRWLPYYIEDATYYETYPDKINNSRDFTYCLLSNLIDFSKAYSDVNLDEGKQRILLCKNELKEEITNANLSKIVNSIKGKQFSDEEINNLVKVATLGYSINSEEVSDKITIDGTEYDINNAFELLNPSIIQLNKKIIEGDGLLSGSNLDGLFGNDDSLKNENYYLLFYNTGLYLGNYGEVTEDTADSNIWYMMSTYIPSDGKTGYGINNGPLGIFLRLDKEFDVRELTVSKLKALCGTSDLNRTKTNGFYQIPKDQFKTLNNEIEVFDSSKEYLDQNGVSFGTLSGALKEILINSGVTEEDLPDGDVNVIVADGIVYYRHPTYKYDYNNTQYVVWVQIKPTDQVEDSFLISNPNVNNEDVNIDNVTNIYIVNCPKLLTGFESNLNEDDFDILEYSSINVQAKSTFEGSMYNYGKPFDIKQVDGSETEFTFDIGENPTEFQSAVINDQAITYERSNKYQYGIINRDENNYVYYTDPNTNNIKNAINILYTVENQLTNSISKDKIITKQINILAESSLIPIGYINILSAQAVTAVDDNGNLDNLYYIGSKHFEEGKFNNTGVVTRMIDEFGNDCPYDFKNIYFKFNTETPGAEGYDDSFYTAYTFTKPQNESSYINQGYSLNITDIIDASLNININDNSLLIKNNKIHNDNISVINPLIFRLSELNSLLQNNTFINCTNLGSAIKTHCTGGSNLKMYDCVFNSCEDLDIVDYFNVYNNKFFNCTGNIDVNGDTSGNLPIKNIINSTFYNVDFGPRYLSYHGDINTCTMSDISLEGYGGANYVFSNIYDTSSLGNTSGENNIISYGNNLNIDLNKHQINADSNDFIINSKLGTNTIKATNIQILGSENLPTTYTTQAYGYNTTRYIYPYIQNGSFYGSNTSSSTRDNAKANNNSNYNTINIKIGKNGNYKSVLQNSKIELGEIYVVGSWRMYTRKIAAKGVGAETLLKVESVTLKVGDKAATTENIGVSSSISSGGYWSEAHWSSGYQTVFINLTQILKSLKDKQGVIDDDGNILLASTKKSTPPTASNFGNGNDTYYDINEISIDIRCSGYCRAYSEGIWDSVGSVYISDIYYDSTKTTKTMTRNYKGDTSSKFNYNSYKVSYLKAIPAKGGNMEMLIGKDCIRFASGDSTLSFIHDGGWKIISNDPVTPVLKGSSDT